MPSLHEIASGQFAQWERRGRGHAVWPHPVPPEPPFRPFLGYRQPPPDVEDDGRKPTFLSSLAEFVGRKLAPRPPGLHPREEPEEEPVPGELVRGPLVELQTSLPAKLDISREAFAGLLGNFALCREPLAFEILGTPGRVRAQFAAHPDDTPHVRRQLRAFFPEAVFLPGEGALEAAWEEAGGSAALVVEFGLEREFMIPLQCGRLDPFVGIVGALAELPENHLGLFQVLFQQAAEDWPGSMARSVADAGGKPLFVNRPELAGAVQAKVESPLFAAVVRIAAKAGTGGEALALARELAGALRVFNHPGANALIPLTNAGYPFEEHVEDLLSRQSRRSGMILNTGELSGFVHLPSSAVRSPAFGRDTEKTREAPALARNPEGILLGFNLHAGRAAEVRLTPDQRVQHTHVIGASGTGKSTLLLQLIRQGIEAGEGVGLLDPHGDLVEAVLRIIPPSRVGDVVLVDPSDESGSVGFNILSAHSDLEKNLLASDLASIFKRLSTSWGDQMGIVLQNAILAMLESGRGGTLLDMRRFLVEPAFRREFLESVRDPNVLYYWREAFTQLAGNKSIGPVLTRLEAFLAPRPIRHMVSQRENRLDFGQIMSQGAIFLAKLPHGLMGRENAFLLGSLIVAKFQQLAMGRQAERIESRRPFHLHIDEFQNFITPSMAEILSGARKYRLGLVLAHQELHHLDRDRDVGSAVLSNPLTRVVFRTGDADARKLAEGFAHFDAMDIQNLETGQALCRVGKSADDFNLAIARPSPPSPEEGEARREAAIQASRAKYSVPRAELEAREAESMAARRDRKPSGTSPEGPEPPGRGAPKRRKEPAPTRAGSVPGESAANPEEPPPSLEEILKASPPKADGPPPETQATPPPDLGRGGAQHRAVQKRIKQAAEAAGFRGTIEKEILQGKGSVDLLLERAGEAIACEIAITTTIDHEVGNVLKCLKAGFPSVAVIATDPGRLAKLREAVIQSLGPEKSQAVSFFQPDPFMEHLARLPAPQPGQTTVIRRGYRVRRSVSEADAAGRARKEEEAIRTLVDTMRRK